MIEQVDEMIKIKFIEENEEHKKIWICTDDPKLNLIKTNDEPSKFS